MGAARKDLTGETHGEWTVLYRQEGHFMWHCRCSCGTEADVCGNNLQRGYSRSCGCRGRGKDWSKANRLAVAGYAAPRIRAGSSRRVARVDADGKVVGYTTLAEVQRSLLRQREIEIDTRDGVRPKEIVCAACGRLAAVASKGIVPRFCRECVTDAVCACGKPCGKMIGYQRLRRGATEPSQCRACHIKNKQPAIAARAGAISGAKRMGKSTGRALPKPHCHKCGKEMNKNSGIPSVMAKRKGLPRCKQCKTAAPRPPCFDCGRVLSPDVNKTKSIAARNGGPPRCRTCSNKSRRTTPSESKAEP